MENFFIICNKGCIEFTSEEGGEDIEYMRMFVEYKDGSV